MTPVTRRAHGFLNQGSSNDRRRQPLSVNTGLMTQNRLRILLVEDHAALAANIFDYLEGDAYELDHAADGLTALHLMATHSYDVIVLDIMLPGIDGFSLCRRLRDDLRSATPVLMLTARDSIDDKTLGFTAGADDYLVKPFAMKELELRIQALYRRVLGRQERIEVGPLNFDVGQQRALVQGVPLSLPPSAVHILELLMRSYPRLVSHEELAHGLWGDVEADANALRTHLSTLRKELRKHGVEHLLHTVHGRGYRLAKPGEV